jgi:hypothetical protein
MPRFKRTQNPRVYRLLWRYDYRDRTPWGPGVERASLRQRYNVQLKVRNQQRAQRGRTAGINAREGRQTRLEHENKVSDHMSGCEPVDAVYSFMWFQGRVT